MRAWLFVSPRQPCDERNRSRVALPSPSVRWERLQIQPVFGLREGTTSIFIHVITGDINDVMSPSSPSADEPVFRPVNLTAYVSRRQGQADTGADVVWAAASLLLRCAVVWSFSVWKSFLSVPFRHCVWMKVIHSSVKASLCWPEWLRTASSCSTPPQSELCECMFGSTWLP